jgi:hypothetical protein
LKTTLKIDIHHLAQFHVEVKDEYDLDDDDEQIDVNFRVPRFIL